MKNLLKFLTILFVAITLSALMAHLLELRGKINLSKEDYQVVQGIYSGWAWLGIFEIGAILLMVIWTVSERKTKSRFTYLMIASVCFIVSIIIFFLFTFPANQATKNWTELPQGWELLRQKWEYSHAIRAALNLTGFGFLAGMLISKDR